jgi:superoxide reductase
MAALIVNNGPSISCCGEKMAELAPNTVDASREKHVPSVTKNGDAITVRVGEAAHPMEEKHYIQFIYVSTKNGGQRKNLRPGDDPAAAFSFTDDEPTTVYAGCNIHGLWACEL